MEQFVSLQILGNKDHILKIDLIDFSFSFAFWLIVFRFWSKNIGIRNSIFILKQINFSINQYDLFYIKNLSIALDLFIIVLTVKTVLLRRGAK